MPGLLRILILLVTAGLTAAGNAEPVITILPDGTLSIQGSADIPPYAEGGSWQESTTRESDRFVTRHFLFTRPGKSPAMEVYVTADRSDEPSDGVFETSMVRGYLASFSSGIGFSYDSPVFEDVAIASARAKLCRVELSKSNRRIWLYAYIFPRRPSLVFLTMRPQADTSGDIEEYLSKVRLK